MCLNITNYYRSSQRYRTEVKRVTYMGPSKHRHNLVYIIMSNASEGLAQGPCVASSSGVETMTLRTKGVDSTNAPYTPYNAPHTPHFICLGLPLHPFINIFPSITVLVVIH